MENKKILPTVIGIVVSLAVLYATVYVIGKAWKSA
jgi:hypothetical protein